MDYTTLLIVVGIVAYGISEYHRREALHVVRMSHLSRGEHPPSDVTRVEFWQVLTTGGVAILLAAMSGGLLVLEFRTGVKFGPFAQVGGFFGLLLVLVVLMFVHTVTRYRRQTAGGGTE